MSRKKKSAAKQPAPQQQGTKQPATQQPATQQPPPQQPPPQQPAAKQPAKKATPPKVAPKQVAKQGGQQAAPKPAAPKQAPPKQNPPKQNPPKQNPPQKVTPKPAASKNVTPQAAPKPVAPQKAAQAPSPSLTRTSTVRYFDPLDYMTKEDLLAIDKQFAQSLHGQDVVLFWTGVECAHVQRWARNWGLKTLTMAMGPLMDPACEDSPKARKGKRPYSRYIKGASGRFAQYACRHCRGVVVLTNPPPDIYSTRDNNTYQQLEEPILKGLLPCRDDTPCPPIRRIDYLHPTVDGAAHVSYQAWPCDKSQEWAIPFGQRLVKKWKKLNWSYHSLTTTSELQRASNMSSKEKREAEQPSTSTLQALLPPAQCSSPQDTTPTALTTTAPLTTAPATPPATPPTTAATPPPTISLPTPPATPPTTAATPPPTTTSPSTSAPTTPTPPTTSLPPTPATTTPPTPSFPPPQNNNKPITHLRDSNTVPEFTARELHSTNVEPPSAADGGEDDNHGNHDNHAFHNQAPLKQEPQQNHEPQQQEEQQEEQQQEDKNSDRQMPPHLP
ncbi:hypothetical protein DV738_g1913, partial [Chaetothyriales sp. CBS 135597]